MPTTSTAAPLTVPATRPGRPIPGLRWYVISLIFACTAINYVDRQSFSLLYPVLHDELGIDPIQFSRIATTMVFAYMVSQSVSGKFYDRFGPKTGFTCSIILWSLACIGQAWIRGFWSWAVLAFLLGFGEAGNWPGAAKVVAQWFPARERALGMGIFNSGASTGSVIAPPLVIGLQACVGWRTTRALVGALGFVWLAVWLLTFFAPDKHPNITQEELDHINDTPPPAPVSEQIEDPDSSSIRHSQIGIRHSPSLTSDLRPLTSPPPPPTWRQLLRHRQTWAIVIARVIVDPIWWLFVFWLPGYLKDARGFSLKEIGAFAWIPYAAAACGALTGGYLAGHLIARRGWSVDRARKSVILAAACLTPAGVAAAYAPGAALAIALISVVLFAFQMWISNVQTLPSDFFESRAVASVAGLGGTGAGVGSMIFTLATGWVVTHFSYNAVLVTAGLLCPLGTAALFLLAGPIKRINLDHDS